MLAGIYAAVCASGLFKVPRALGSWSILKFELAHDAEGISRL